jgi:hypothetical protein
MRVAYIADGEKEGLDTDAGRWQAICRYHGAILSLTSRSAAQAEINHANERGSCGEWCEDCQAYDDQRATG